MNTFKRRALALLLAVLALIGLSSALAAAGGADDPLISLSFLSGYSATVIAEAKAVFTNALTGVYDDAVAMLESRGPSSSFGGYSVGRNGTVSLQMGGSVILISGSGALTVESGTVVNVSTGEVVANGAVLHLNERYMAVENTTATVNIVTPSSVTLDGAAAVSQAGSALTFSDVPESFWAFEYINELASRSIVGGVGDGLFNPAGNMTRADFVTILGRLHKVKTSNYPSADFKDVPDGQYYTPYVEWAAQNRIVTGYGDGNFGPRDSITRDQMAAIIVRYCEYAGIELPSNGSEVVFADDASIQSWARWHVYVAMRAGLINGKGGGIYDPLGKSSRAEVCTIIFRLINLD